MSEVIEKGKIAKQASYSIQNNSTEEKNAALEKIAAQLIQDQDEILEANKKDLNAGRENGLPESTLDRIMLDKDRIESISEGVRLVVSLEDPIGEVLESIDKDNGLHIEKVRVPLGVIGMIYEARPNVTVDAAALCLKAGNAVILRGSSSARNSNIALVKSIHKALENSDVSKDAVQLIEDTSRENAQQLFNLTEYLDVLIPRGGEGLINLVARESTVPVLITGAGNCHLYIDESAPYDKAKSITVNAKVQRPSVCNAIEGLVVQKDWFKEHGKSLLDVLGEEHKVDLYGDDLVREICPNVNEATETDWATEYLDMVLSVKIVDDVEEAIQFINTYGTGHSEGIVTEDENHAERFLSQVDATSVYHNASTRFTDGAEFGYGAEIGISTQKLHARGPMGLPALTSTKYLIRGNGQVRE